MFALLISSYAVLNGVEALPILSNLDQKTAPSETCTDLNNCRGLSDIILSCLATLLSCTWIALHPNIPGPSETWLKITLRQFGLMILALIAPELIVVWAMRQWISSRIIANRYESANLLVSYLLMILRLYFASGYRWTQTHGFFALMGGFMGFESGKPVRTLLPDDLEPYLKSGQICITEEMIKDKSKGDALSKGFVILQTGWFALQCIARGIEQKPITELELSTLAFAALTFLTYGLWWKKPLNVSCPIGVDLDLHIRRSRDASVVEQEQDITEACGPLRLGVDVGSSNYTGHAPDPYPSVAEQRRDGEVLEACGMASPGRKVKGRTRLNVAIMGAQFQIEFTTIARFLMSPVNLYYAITGFREDAPNHADLRVGTFYGCKKYFRTKQYILYIGAPLASVVFGAIHCIGWSFQFPTQAEQIIWRSCSIITTCAPLYTVLYPLMIHFLPLRPIRLFLTPFHFLAIASYVLLEFYC
jgi:hypothetical protein